MTTTKFLVSAFLIWNWESVRLDMQIKRKFVDAGAGGCHEILAKNCTRLLGARLNVALNLRLVLPRCGAQIVGAL
jgi:hypothetical protein